MHIAILASEAVPYAKTGGLADVTTALSKELVKLVVETKPLPFLRLSQDCSAA